MRPRFAYLHVPKVAGSSVSSALAAAAPEARRARYLLDRTLFGGFDRFDEVDPVNAASVWDPSRGDLDTHDVVVGHFSLASLLTGFESFEVAMLLREPRARLLSHYSFWRGWDPPIHDGWAPYAASRRAVELEWAEFLSDPSIAAQTDNLAIRMLVGPDPDIPPDDFIDAAALDDLATRALHRQRSLGHVDVIERSGCWDRLGDWLDTTLDMQRVNVTALASGPPIQRGWFDDTASNAVLDQRTRGDRLLWSDAGGADDVADVVWRRHVDKIVESFEQSPTDGSLASCPTAGGPGVEHTASAGRTTVRRLWNRIGGRT